MKEQLQQRLETLKAEFESGQKVLAELEAKQTNVRETLLRISGAIQVLEEMLASEQGSEETVDVEPADPGQDNNQVVETVA
jgi:predicted nuclease with TOPRIM domain